MWSWMIMRVRREWRRVGRLVILGLWGAGWSAAGAGLEPARMVVAGDWRVEVTVRTADGQKSRGVVEVTPAAWVEVKAERIAALPVFNPQAGGWVKGVALAGVRAQECTTTGLLEPDSLTLRLGPEEGDRVLERGVDYEADLFWGTLGRLTNGAVREGQPVFASYRHGMLRLDSVVLTGDHHIEVRKGEATSAAPRPPDPREGERRLGNVWIPGRVARLTSDHLFPLLEEGYPEPAVESPSPAERWAPRAVAKLRSGERLRVMAWGDSVTVGTYLPEGEKGRWQEQFVERLRARFPKAQIELVTEAWGGRSTGSYLAEPPGSEHHYGEKVLGAKPDLVVSEFVNDAGLDEAGVEERYGRLRTDFAAVGAEWIILTPHYVRMDWMGLTREREVDEDPRPYVRGLRQFAARHGVGLADASLRYGRLWRQGIPYSTLMLNSINHPDVRGMALFADSLLALFPVE